MNVELRCEACDVMLRVPAAAAGHRARCPSCSHEFTVPATDALLEDTVSQWIGQDVEEVFEDRNRHTDTAVRAADRSSRAAVQAPPSTPASRDEQDGDHDHRRERDRDGRRRRLWPMRPQQREALPGGVALPEMPTEAPAPDSVDHPIVSAPPTAPPPEPVDVPRHAADPVAERPEGSERYPSNLHIEGRIPHLMVQKVDSAGVRFAFDSQWLNEERFRASMPPRCAFSGSTTREKLIARPLIFLDRSQHARPSFDTITAAHENRQLSDRSPREITRMMGLIEGMPHPFTYAMPYYVTARFAHLPLHCETRDRTSGGITCEVIIPDQLTALDWLARVNGVCGKEYELLERDVSLLHGDAWQHLSEDARGRIAVWCKLGPREVLRHYFSDADFGRRDAGLAGLVVTDQRLVFCKYHHRGQVPLDTQDAAILARCDARFANLALRVGSDLSRMIKLHRHDLDELAHALASRGKIALQVTQA